MRRRVWVLLLTAGILVPLLVLVLPRETARVEGPPASPPVPTGPFRVTRAEFDWGDSLTTHAVAWTPSRDSALPPLLIFSPGFGQRPDDYSVMLEELASHGIGIIGVTHPAFTDPDRLELYDAVPVLAAQLERVMAWLVRRQSGGDSAFAWFDPARIGLLGHSIGGAAAALACNTGPPCRGAMDLDGTLFGSVVHTGMTSPFFLLRRSLSPADTAGDPPAFFEKRDQARLHEDSAFAHSSMMYWLAVDSLDHMSFTDDALRAGISGRSSLEAMHAQRIAIDHALAFFGAVLRSPPDTPEFHHITGTTLRWHHPE